MTPEKFMNLPMKKKLETVNQLLEKETKDHLKNVSEKLGLPYNTFTKMMRDNGNFHYNQSIKRYEKLMSLEDYEKYLQLQSITNHGSNEALKFVEDHLDDLRSLLGTDEKQLVLDPKVYDLTTKTGNKSLQLNLEIFEAFSRFIATEFPHYRQRDLLSQSLLEFIRKYQKAPSE